MKVIPLPSIEFEYSMKVIRFLSSKPNWIYQWILNDITFPLLPEHKEILTNTINDINEIELTDDEYDIHDTYVNIKDFFIDEYINEDLFLYLVISFKIISVLIHSLLTLVFFI